MRNYLLFKLRKEWQNKSWWELSNFFKYICLTTRRGQIHCGRGTEQQNTCVAVFHLFPPQMLFTDHECNLTKQSRSYQYLIGRQYLIYSLCYWPPSPPIPFYTRKIEIFMKKSQNPNYYQRRRQIIGPLNNSPQWCSAIQEICISVVWSFIV